MLIILALCTQETQISNSNKFRVLLPSSWLNGDRFPLELSPLEVDIVPASKGQTPERRSLHCRCCPFCRRALLCERHALVRLIFFIPTTKSSLLSLRPSRSFDKILNRSIKRSPFVRMKAKYTSRISGRLV